MILNTTVSMLLLSSTASLSANETKPYPQMVNHSLVIEVVRTINELYKFKNFVFFISERLVSDTDTSTVFFDDFWDAFPTAPTILIINNTVTMAGFLSTPTLCLVLTTEVEDPIMELSSLSMKGIRYFKTIFILFPIVETDEFYSSFESYTTFNDHIRLLYDWIWRKQFLNTILITIRNNLYIHEPYPTATIVNKTENWTVTDFFMEYDVDFQGYQLNTMVKHDMPRVFRMKRLPPGRKTKELSGVSGKMFSAFVSSINATFNDTEADNDEADSLDINSIIHMVEEKDLEMGVNSYTAMIASLVGASYPIGINDWCLMVPFRNTSPQYLYLRRSFTSYSWYLLCLSVIYIAVGIWLCTPNKERDLSLSFLQSLCSLILIVPLRLLTLPYFRLRFLFVLLFVIGFFLTNMFMSKMASFFTTPTKQPQIDSVLDIIQAKLPIMMMDYEYDRLRELNYPEAFYDLIKISTKGEMDRHRDRFNTTFGYSIQTDRWQFLNKQQHHLIKPIFRMTSVCIGPFYHVFPIQRDSHLAKPLQNFIMSASQYGLRDHWESEAFLDALFVGYVRMMLVDYGPTPLQLEFFRNIYILWWLGLVLAGLCFICEIKGITLQVVKRAGVKCVRKLREISNLLSKH